MKNAQSSDDFTVKTESTSDSCLSESADLNESPSTDRRRVIFKNILIREYPICVGDNPSVSVGAPITIGWDYDPPLVCSIDDYEEHKPDKRNMAELRIPPTGRNEMLKRLGFSLREIQEGKKTATIGRNKRKQTNASVQAGKQPTHEFLERAVRATLNATFRRSAKKKEREMLAQFKSERMTTTLDSAV